MKWFEDPPSNDFRRKVLSAAEAELAKLRPATSRRFFMLRLTTGFAAAAVGIFTFNKFKKQNTEPEFTAANVDPALLDDLPLVQNLELWQDLELFESWRELDKDV